MKLVRLLLIAPVFVSIASPAYADTPTPTPTPSVSPTTTTTSTPTPQPTVTETVTVTASPVPGPTVTVTASPVPVTDAADNYGSWSNWSTSGAEWVLFIATILIVIDMIIAYTMIATR